MIPRGLPAARFPLHAADGGDEERAHSVSSTPSVPRAWSLEPGGLEPYFE